MKWKQLQVLQVLSLGDLVDRVAARTGLFKREVRAVLEAAREEVLSQVSAGNAVRWHRLGIFLPRPRFTRRRGADGRAAYELDPSRLGLVFYPSDAAATLRAAVDVRSLVDRGEYRGPRHDYAAR